GSELSPQDEGKYAEDRKRSGEGSHRAVLRNGLAGHHSGHSIALPACGLKVRAQDFDVVTEAGAGNITEGRAELGLADDPLTGLRRHPASLRVELPDDPAHVLL